MRKQETPLVIDRELKAKHRRSRRYAGRRTLWKITSDKACRGCGRTLMDPETGVVFARTAEGTAIALGLLKCGRIWFCPVCSAKIRHGRGQEVTKAVVSWIKRGGQAYLVTFAARHAHAHALADLMDAIQGSRSGTKEEIQAARAAVAEAKAAVEDAGARAKAAVQAARISAPKGAKRKAMAHAKAAATVAVDAAQARLDAARAELAATTRQAGAYQRLITGGAWAGNEGRGTEGIRLGIGYVGMIRATEVTVGQGNGWHPHIHAIVLVGGAVGCSTGDDRAPVVADTFEPSAEALAKWETHWRSVWTSHLERIDPTFRPSDACLIPGCKCQGKGHGVDFKRLETVQDAKAMGDYLAKTQDGKDPANELTRGDLKSGRQGNMTPFQALGRIGDLMGGVPEEDADGHGSLGWLLALWAEYESAMSGRRAIEWTRHLRPLLGLDGGDTEDDDLDVLFELDAAHDFRDGVQIQERAWHKITGKALDLAVVEAVEGDELQDDVVTALAVQAGSVAGSVRRLTAEEVTAVAEAAAAKLAERREVAAERRRKEREQARRSDS
ncbi:hypothetical protein ACGFLS_32420 [Streptomyces abikoensis]|uniref:hypothetical protein n=1 Tax=Streptomyces abikoensis TaxID=97398 RepID=UPI003718F9F8